jgi:ABC-type xylose transport system permease subunit
LRELVALAKAQPHRLNFPSPGVASIPYLAMEDFDRARKHATEMLQLRRNGRHWGDNVEALMSAIERRIVGVFTLMGLLCGIGGIILTARVGAATTDAGRMMELDAIAAAVIGGTSLMGGRGTVWGALLGALVMASLDNGMSLLNTEAFWQPILKGAILVAAVAADMVARRRE